jgi:hypothetical protein
MHAALTFLLAVMCGSYLVKSKLYHSFCFLSFGDRRCAWTASGRASTSSPVKLQCTLPCSFRLRKSLAASRAFTSSAALPFVALLGALLHLTLPSLGFLTLTMLVCGAQQKIVGESPAFQPLDFKTAAAVPQQCHSSRMQADSTDITYSIHFISLV